jgi:hypothetical protein
MIQSAEAEQVIHTHKLALRDIAEAKRAKDRFAQLKKAEAHPKVAEVAQEKMWRNQMKEARTSQERAKVVDEGIKEAIVKYPEQAEQIRKEGESLKGAFEELKEKVKGSPTSSNANGPRKVADEAIQFIRGIQDKIENLLKKIPVIGRTPIGRDLVSGGIIAILEEIEDRTGVNLHVGKVGTLLFGRARSGGLGLIFRGWGKELAREQIINYKVSEAKSQYLSNDNSERAKFPKQSKSIQKKALESIRAS